MYRPGRQALNAVATSRRVLRKGTRQRTPRKPVALGARGAGWLYHAIGRWVPELLCHDLYRALGVITREVFVGLPVSCISRS